MLFTSGLTSNIEHVTSLVVSFFDGTNIEEQFEFFIQCRPNTNLDIASLASNLTAKFMEWTF